MDMINVEMFAEKVIKLTEYRKGQHRYLQSKMDQVAPNLSALIGEQVDSIDLCLPCQHFMLLIVMNN